jgi:hypothetical protein
MIINDIKPFSLKKTLALLAFCTLGAPAAFSQQELMLHTMPDLWHATSTNPAFFPEGKKIVVGLPGIGVDLAHSGELSYDDVFVKNGDRTLIDFSNALAKLDPTNTLRVEQRTETVSLGLRLPGGFALQAGHANRLSGAIEYPKTLPSLIWEGNGPYIGQTVEIAPTMDVFDWNEWSVGLSKGFGKVRLGLRAKYLTGVSALKSDEAHRTATVTTSSDIYQLSLATDYGFYASSLVSAIDTSGLGFDVSLGSLSGKAFSQSQGFAFDLGAQLKLNERITLDLALLDLGGKITWDDEKAQYFRSQGNYTYEGATLPGADIINGADSLDFTAKLDTLNDIFNFQKSAQSFETTLPLRGYAGVSFALNARWTFGVSGYFQKFGERQTGAAALNARWKPLRWLSLGAMYSVNDRSATNLGLHLALTPGPVQVYFASDNLLNALSVKKNSAANLRAGLALAF